MSILALIMVLVLSFVVRYLQKTLDEMAEELGIIKFEEQAKLRIIIELYNKLEKIERDAEQ